MTYRFTLFSQGVEDFVMEILIDAEASFSDLHRLIIDFCHYEISPDQMFLLCDDDWRVTQSIRLVDDGTLSSEEDLLLMQDCTLRDFMEDEGQHLALIYNKAQHGIFLMELTENIFGKPQPKPCVSRSRGNVPSWENEEEEEVEEKQVEEQQAADANEPDNLTDDTYDSEDLDFDSFEIEENE